MTTYSERFNETKDHGSVEQDVDNAIDERSGEPVTLVHDEHAARRLHDVADDVDARRGEIIYSGTTEVDDGEGPWTVILRR